MRSFLRIVLLLVIAVAAAGAYWWQHAYQELSTRPLVTDNRLHLVELAPGSSVRHLAELLVKKHWIRYPRVYRLVARFKGISTHIQAGEYQVTSGMTAMDLLRKMAAGEVYQHSLTLVEGWTFRQVMAAVEGDSALKHTLVGLNDKQIMERLGHPGKYPEGLFFPDTYHFPRGTTDVEFLQRAYDTMSRHLRQEWADRAPGLPLKKPYDALILASLIEKETAVPTERPKVAGVFIRRLEKHMRLQTDPSVIYGLGSHYDGKLHTRDLKHDTPYNTYTRFGLPPTPIAMPGLPSIHAALHPAPGKALYFVAKGNGTHQFSDTLAEHDRAVRKYQLGESGK